MANLWDKSNVPHKGWTCVSVYDVRGDGCPVDETEYETCEMCGKERIRYVHTMEHDEHSSLNVGCICACKMSNDYVGPKQRERILRNKAARRTAWLTREWKKSAEGNLYLNLEGYNIGVFENRWNLGRWSYRIGGIFSKDNYATDKDAKLALFEEFWESKTISDKNKK